MVFGSRLINSICVVYVAITSGYVYNLFNPPRCTSKCTGPLFTATELETADLYVFVSDLDMGRFREESYTGLPPVDLARAAARVHREYVRGSTSEVAAEGAREVQQVGIGAHIKFATVVRDLALRKMPVGSVQWQQRLRLPVFASTRRENVTLHGLFFLCPQGRPLDPDRYPIEVPTWRDFEESVLFATVPLTKHAPRTGSSGYVNLLDNSSSIPRSAEKPEARVVSHWKFSSHPLRLRLVAPLLAVPRDVVFLHPDGQRLWLQRVNPHFFSPPAVEDMEHPPAESAGSGALRGLVQATRSNPYQLHRRLGHFERSMVDRHTQERVGTLVHRPYFYVDDWTVLRRQLMMLSENMSYPDPSVALHLSVVSLGRMRAYKMADLAFKYMLELHVLSDGDLDELRRYMSDEYMFRFLLMQAIGLAHTVLSFMAFKNDVGFWKGRESVAGLSSRTVIFNAFASLIIFLYLMDYSTSIFVLGTTLGGTCVDFWKVLKILKIRRKRSDTSSGFLAWLGLERGSYNVSEKRTASLDATAMDMLTLAISPLVVGFALYSLVYDRHKSWYSWVVESLANGIYVFGFIFMTPQLFINYKLKSTAHLPWKVMCYKFFSTFIDDVFSFLVAMPTSHRVACFRDDIVFFIFLYQRWLYPVDPTRANEYGYAYDDGDDTNKISGENETPEAHGSQQEQDSGATNCRSAEQQQQTADQQSEVS